MCIEKNFFETLKFEYLIWSLNVGFKKIISRFFFFVETKVFFFPKAVAYKFQTINLPSKPLVENEPYGNRKKKKRKGLRISDKK